ncbi:unnamed protein product [Pleuronectes platessa]|uniref:Uncharacterized protein n=1 Tax=Pleuronectes platessa TaxID=8262 RepID=A0A9N7UIC0_PLEPL|nr:unnamed protein product [Pleuronectes platessa]
MRTLWLPLCELCTHEEADPSAQRDGENKVERPSSLWALLLCRAADGLIEPARHTYIQTSNTREEGDEGKRRTKKTSSDSRESERGKIQQKGIGRGKEKERGEKQLSVLFLPSPVVPWPASG